MAQRADATVRGRVVDEAGLPVAGATVLLGDQTAVTDGDGAFVVIGGGKLTVVAGGYASQTVGAADGVVVRLAPASGEVITVSGRAPEETKPLDYTISAADVRTTPGAMNDALRAVTVLPAAARIPFSFGGLVLRGMSPRDSSVFIDGVEIPLAFHFGGITGVFPTQVLGDMKVVPSGFDVSIGRTQGGAIELESRTPRGDAYRVGGEVSLLHSIASVEGPLPGRGAFLVALRRSYFDVLARPLLEPSDPLPSYTDGQIRAVWGDVARRGQLAVYAIGSLDRIANSSDAARPNDPEADGYLAANLGFLRTGASYKRRIDNTLVTIAPVLGTNLLSLSSKDYHGTAMAEELDLNRRWYVFGGRGEWLRDDPGGFLRAGIDVSGGYLGRVSATVFQQDVDDFPSPATPCCGPTPRSSSRRAATGSATGSRSGRGSASIGSGSDAFRALANYAWSRSKRKYDPALGGGWEPYGLDQPLRLNLLFSTTAFRWNVGARLTAVSGNPAHLVPEGTPVPDGPDDPSEVLVRLPTFWQVDLRIDRMWKRPWGSISLFFDIQNITNHRNVELRESRLSLTDPGNINSPLVYRYDDVRGLPILPYIGVEFVPR